MFMERMRRRLEGKQNISSCLIEYIIFVHQFMCKLKAKLFTQIKEKRKRKRKRKKTRNIDEISPI
jgi:hypothetical protein